MSKLTEFKKMHEQNKTILIPTTWDILSAIILEQTGFKAIATASYSIANAFGYNDGERITFENMLYQIKGIVSSVNIPVSADLESGYSENPETVCENIIKVADLGAVGINIEDSYKDKPGMKSKEVQSELISKIRQKLDSNGYKDFYLNARTDTYLQKTDPLEETIEKAKSYADAGATGIFVPGLYKREQIKDVVNSIKVPLHLVSNTNLTNVDELSQLGVKRLSTGPSLSMATIKFMEEKARLMYNDNNVECLYNNNVGIKTKFK
ncbi:MAG: isocitrate lyase/phosphoenolpyruvate mutase family protein [Spirochaetes bacterium]|nr:isocitrate lyase/phosphoenolpyruvate mutase family protein [Spirochaetota bacterium]